MTKINSEHGSVAAYRIDNSIIQIINQNGAQISQDEASRWEAQYLRGMIHDCGGLGWLASLRYQEKNAPAITLDRVYTPLLVESYRKESDRHKDVRAALKKDARTSLVEALNKESHLVLTGAPGSGKSAFVNYLVLCLAGALLGGQGFDLETLTRPLPRDSDEETDLFSFVDEEEAPESQPQSWDHGGLLPVRVILRDFAASEFFPKGGESGGVGHVLAFIKNELQAKGCEEYFKVLKVQLREGQTLVMFDGLDEVAEAGERRERMIECINAFAKTWDKTRLLATCRPYAYEKPEWQIPDFQRVGLRDFKKWQIKYFIDHWYAAHPEFTEERAGERAKKLRNAIFERDALHDLARRPLLLTLTAYLHANQHELPEQRAELYERLLNLLIEKWEAARFKTRDCDDAHKLEQHSLAEFLRVDIDKIRLVLERLAFKVHDAQEQPTGTADIAAKDLTHELVYTVESVSGAASVDHKRISEYLRDRVGILHQRGGNSDYDAVYTFPHRSFQEYLAASYFRREEDYLFDRFSEDDFEEWQEVAAHLGRVAMDKWREVVLLAGGIGAKRDPGAVRQLVEALFSGPENKDCLSAEESRGVLLASEIIVENLDLSRLARKYRRVVEQIQQNLPLVLVSTYLPALDRVLAGKHLAKIGDPRLEVMAVDAMQFCRVDAGPFFLGSTEADGLAGDDEKKGAGEYNLHYDYWLARYPVTVAQYGRFVEETGHQPIDDDCLRASDNTPVVYVTWHEAMKFCDWLTNRWQEKGWLPKGYIVTLPSEPEWEKAAKGGTFIPESAPGVIEAVEACSAPICNVMENPNPQRLYPWDGQVDAERLNYDGNIDEVSAVGCYPRGVSPYGCEELSGNVWEWTRSVYEPYPYPQDQSGRQQRETRQGDERRALRGGAFYYSGRYARCAARHRDDPENRDLNDGFRVSLSPSTSDI